ncbi:DEAD/DEAH box helicase [Aureibacter tunicatorum]|uniref:ATP-dependent RNA helicase RhlE n=1 Tax=Aureibacter tunicatorum TaxID=866807 RepID=A0AAE3XRY6_9BACT|nr:DEAD/DEAH box helicase [Aureibacter tunicatorum]MDR6241522.1 ATP-dependent RNA helicase RhlE [Aureibacter tunicatorum]BDD07020.1 ATP-dependent RNA helicase RhlE [Aureibacter tunicatorum]
MNKNIKRQKHSKSNKKPASELNPADLIKKAVPLSESVYVSERNYSHFNFHKLLSKNLKNKGYVKPTEIQDKSIDQLISGKNIVGIADTGTGKTGAFLIPIIQQMLTNQNITALVVVPTRELALQVMNEFKSLTTNTQLKSACFIGGTSISKDIALARRKNNIVIGTPGRLIDLMNKGSLNIQSKSILVMDEFDRMLDMGFIRDVEKIIASMKNRKQSMLFSATLDKSQEKLIAKFVNKPIRLNVSSGTNSSDNVDQEVIHVAHDENKFDLLYNLVSDESFKKVILFAETKRMVDRLSKKLVKSGIKSDVIHGDKSQNYRAKAINSFKSGKTKILVATDVAARGIDIKEVTHVINYQLPLTMDSYIHRIGRTGRANQKGMAYTFVN